MNEHKQTHTNIWAENRTHRFDDIVVSDTNNNTSLSQLSELY